MRGNLFSRVLNIEKEKQERTPLSTVCPGIQPRLQRHRGLGRLDGTVIQNGDEFILASFVFRYTGPRVTARSRGVVNQIKNLDRTLRDGLPLESLFDQDRGSIQDGSQPRRV